MCMCVCVCVCIGERDKLKVDVAFKQQGLLHAIFNLSFPRTVVCPLSYQQTYIFPVSFSSEMWAWNNKEMYF